MPPLLSVSSTPTERLSGVEEVVELDRVGQRAARRRLGEHRPQGVLLAPRAVAVLRSPCARGRRAAPARRRGGCGPRPRLLGGLAEVDVDAAHRVDHRPEAGEIDHGEVVDPQLGQVLHRADQQAGTAGRRRPSRCGRCVAPGCRPACREGWTGRPRSSGPARPGRPSRHRPRSVAPRASTPAGVFSDRLSVPTRRKVSAAGRRRSRGFVEVAERVLHAGHVVPEPLREHEREADAGDEQHHQRQAADGDGTPYPRPCGAESAVAESAEVAAAARVAAGRACTAPTATRHRSTRYSWSRYSWARESDRRVSTERSCRNGCSPRPGSDRGIRGVASGRSAVTVRHAARLDSPTS